MLAEGSGSELERRLFFSSGFFLTVARRKVCLIFDEALLAFSFFHGDHVGESPFVRSIVLPKTCLMARVFLALWSLGFFSLYAVSRLVMEPGLKCFCWAKRVFNLF